MNPPELYSGSNSFSIFAEPKTTKPRNIAQEVWLEAHQAVEVSPETRQRNLELLAFFDEYDGISYTVRGENVHNQTVEIQSLRPSRDAIEGIAIVPRNIGQAMYGRERFPQYFRNSNGVKFEVYNRYIIDKNTGRGFRTDEIFWTGYEIPRYLKDKEPIDMEEDPMSFETEFEEHDYKKLKVILDALKSGVLVEDE